MNVLLDWFFDGFLAYFGSHFGALRNQNGQERRSETTPKIDAEKVQFQDRTSRPTEAEPVARRGEGGK